MKTILFVFAISIILCMSTLVQGADKSYFADSTMYNTPDGTITFNLPHGYYMIVGEPFSDDVPFIYEGGWSLESAKNGSSGEQKSYTLTIDAYDADAIEGADADNAFAFKVDETKKYNQDNTEGSYTKIASGQTAWISIGKGEIEGRYNAFIDLVADKNKLIQIRSVPYSDLVQPPAGMTVDDFKNFVESIDIK